MRRTLLFTAGLMMAAGASLALAGPASAAPSATAGCCYNPGNSTYNTSFLSPNTNVQLANLSSVTTQTNLANVGSPVTSVFGNAVGGGGTAYSNSWTTQAVSQYAQLGNGNH
jgi:hypothetical protein